MLFTSGGASGPAQRAGSSSLYICLGPGIRCPARVFPWRSVGEVLAWLWAGSWAGACACPSACPSACQHGARRASSTDRPAYARTRTRTRKNRAASRHPRQNAPERALSAAVVEALPPYRPGCRTRPGSRPVAPEPPRQNRGNTAAGRRLPNPRAGKPHGVAAILSDLRPN